MCSCRKHGQICTGGLSYLNVSILYAVMQHEAQIHPSIWRMLLLISLTLTLCRDIQERDGHSARAYYIREQLPLEATSSYSGWATLAPCDVDWKWRGHHWLLGNWKPGRASDKISISPNINQSCLCYANMEIAFERNAPQLLLAQGWFLKSHIKADRLPQKINNLQFFSTGWLRETLKISTTTHWLTTIWTRKQ